VNSRAVTITVVGAGVLAGLYYGQIVLIPIALAMLLAFILTPPVRALQRLGLGLLLSILLVGVATYSLLGVTAWAVSVQGATLVRAIPQYRDNIRQKSSISAASVAAARSSASSRP
jgi:predicted PurR-regulated permease PerM